MDQKYETFLDNDLEIEGKINKISSKPEDVIPESDILFISSPVHVYENIIKNVSQYLSNGTSIGDSFTQGHLDLMMEKHIPDYKHRNITFLDYNIFHGKQKPLSMERWVI